MKKILKKLKSLVRAFVPLSIRATIYQIRKANRIEKHSLSKHQRLLTEAKAHIVRWELRPALEKINAVLDEQPQSQKALQMRAQVLLDEGRLDEAKSAVDDLLTHYPIDRKGRRLLSAMGEAVPVASMKIALDFALSKRGRPRIFVQGAEYLYDASMFEEALEFVSLGMAALANEKDEKRKEATALDLQKIKADCLENLLRFDEAMEEFERLLHHRPVQLRAATGLARCLLELGQASKAENVLRAANSAANEQNPWSPLMLDILQAQGKVYEAYKFYRTKPLSAAIAEYFDMPHPSTINLHSEGNEFKTALLLSEGGPGDELRLSSVYPDLSKFFEKLTISSDPRLIGIMRRTFPELSFLPV